MAVVETCGDLTVVCVGGSLLLNDRRTSETKIIDVFSKSNNNNNSSNNGQTDRHTDTEKKEEEEEKGRGKEEEDADDDDGRGGGGEKNDKKEEKEENNTENQAILTASFSVDGRYLALGCGWKALEVWDTASHQRVVSYVLVKKPTATVIMGDWVYVADKAGDVYKFPLPSSSSSSSSSKEEPKPILGHLSMLLDVAVTPDNMYIITSDRDEKIRVSNVSRPFEIHSFLLGHREFVTRVRVVSADPPRVLSGSGDGTIKLWNYDTGKLISSFDTSALSSSFLRPLELEEGGEGGVGGGKGCLTPPPQHPSPTPPPVGAVRSFAVTKLEDSSQVAVIIDRTPAVFIFKIHNDAVHHLTTSKLPTIPLAVDWRSGGEVVVVEEGGIVEVLRRKEEEMEVEEEESGLVKTVREAGHWWRGTAVSSSLAHLYKQRYDNVSRYLEKKKERMEVEEAFQQGRGPPPKKEVCNRRPAATVRPSKSFRAHAHK